MSLRKVREERQRMLELIVVIILIGLFINVLATALYNLYPQALFWFYFSLTAVVVLAVYFVFVSRLFVTIIKETVPFVFAVNLKEMYIPVFKLYGSPVSFASIYLRKILEENPELKNKVQKARNDDFDFYVKFFLDLTAFLILNWLSYRYISCWLYEKPLEYSFRRFERPIKRPTIKVKRSDLLSLLENNIFSKLKDPQFFDLALPPNTTISANKTKREWSFMMKNKYCKITISTSFSASSGFWMLQDVPVQFSSDEDRKEFDTLDFFIDFEAKFNRLTSLSPNVRDYYDWAEGMLERLQDDFDWRIQVRKIDIILKALNSERFAIDFAKE